MDLTLDDLHYELPAHLIAQVPLPRRDASRTLFLRRGSERISEGHFSDLPDHLAGDECLVINDTRVIPARVHARRQSGGQVEVFLLRHLEGESWHALLRPARRLRAGEILEHGDHQIRIVERCGSCWTVEFGDLELLQRVGQVPVPPYIKRTGADPELTQLDIRRYQTIYARQPGAVAAPTAGLHFTETVLEKLANRSIPVIPITLHVGPGTFQPIRTEQLADHRVEPELYEVTEEARNQLARAKSEGRKIICVGTTTARVIESLDSLGPGPSIQGETHLTILPGHEFRHMEGLITNFHLPGSSLLALVATFHGLRPLMAAYDHAVKNQLRFYSYGDATVILPEIVP